MALTASPAEGFLTLPIQMPASPSFPISPVHEVRLRRNTPKVPTPTDSRSLFLKNVPADSTEAHFRGVFAHLVGAGKFETILFEDDPEPAAPQTDPARTTQLQAMTTKKRKRDVEELAAQLREEEAARLPSLWTRRVRQSGSSAVVLLVDERSVQLVLRAVRKLQPASSSSKPKPLPVWGESLPESTPELGSPWISSHLASSRCDEAATQAAVHAFFNVFNRKEREAAELAKRLRSEPDEDGFVTVARGGGRAAPASKGEAEEARRRMLEKQRKRKDETRDFYGFQVRERKKAEQAELARRFEGDRERVRAMREKKGRFRPET